MKKIFAAFRKRADKQMYSTVLRVDPITIFVVMAALIVWVAGSS